MKNVLLLALTGFILISCTSDSELALKEKELELKERELDIKEREMELNREEQETSGDPIPSGSTYSNNQSLKSKKNTVQKQPKQEESPSTVSNEIGSSDIETISEAETETSPFSGSGGSGGFESDEGTGSGYPATDAGDGSRIRVSNLTTNPKTPNDQRCKIALKLTVDSRGAVVAASIVRANTTTTNQRLIDEVIALVKKEVKYKEKPGSRNESVYYTITLYPG